jgi:hypothetical protein
MQFLFIIVPCFHILFSASFTWSFCSCWHSRLYFILFCACIWCPFLCLMTAQQPHFLSCLLHWWFMLPPCFLSPSTLIETLQACTAVRHRWTIWHLWHLTVHPDPISLLKAVHLCDFPAHTAHVHMFWRLGLPAGTFSGVSNPSEHYLSLGEHHSTALQSYLTCDVS